MQKSFTKKPSTISFFICCPPLFFSRLAQGTHTMCHLRSRSILERLKSMILVGSTFPSLIFFRFGSAVVVHHRDDNFSISATARTVQSRTEVAIYLLKFSASQNVFLFDLPAVGFRHPLLHYCI